jgi:hypothetical protein
MESILDLLVIPLLEHVDRSEAGVVTPDSQYSSEKDDSDGASFVRR